MKIIVYMYIIFDQLLPAKLIYFFTFELLLGNCEIAKRGIGTYLLQQKYKNFIYLSFWASYSKTKPLFGILVLYAIQF